MAGGLVLAVAGAILWSLGRLGFRGLPGDIQFQSQHIRVYFPIVTCVVLSLALTVVLWVLQWLRNK